MNSLIKPELNLSSKFTKSLIETIRSKSINIEPRKSELLSKLPLIKNIKAVIFDIYGTLFISGTGDIGTINEKKDLNPFSQALSAAGFKILQSDCAVKTKKIYTSAIKKSHNDSKKKGTNYPEVNIVNIWETVLDILLEEKIVSGKKTDTAIHILAVEYEVRSNMVWPMPGSIEILDYLKKKGIITGIVSNAQFYTPLLFPAFFNRSLSDMGFIEELCIWSYRYEHAKPSELLFRILLDKMKNLYNIDASEVLYVGNDMLNDIFTAFKAGCKTALFAGDLRSLRLRKESDLCTGLSSDMILTDLLQLKDLFKRRLTDNRDDEE